MLRIMIVLQWLCVLLLTVLALVSLIAVVAFASLAVETIEKRRAYMRGEVMRARLTSDIAIDFALLSGFAFSAAGLIWAAISIGVGESW